MKAYILAKIISWYNRPEIFSDVVKDDWIVLNLNLDGIQQHGIALRFNSLWYYIDCCSVSCSSV